ncbi:MAG: hypothetical protein DMF98_11255 [Acidobacteria bacterium]|nr:MAG: hypothetical protein DMF98_11255 [Acidobacteriota bacterium]
MQKISLCLWFDIQGEEAARFYTSVFKNSKIGRVTRYDEAAAKAAGRPQGSVMTVDFELDGQRYMALNGGPLFKFTEAISLVVNCETQKEVKDRFGVSWQIVPTILPEMLQDKDPEKAKRVMAAMLKMKKIDIDGLKQAYGGR